jgi:ankyrin repeat protein
MGCNSSNAASAPSSGSAPSNPPPTSQASVTLTADNNIKSAPKEESSPSKSPVSVEAVEINFKPIHSAIRWKKTPDEVRPLLVSPAASNCRDTGNGNVPLHIAAQNGHLELIMLLLEKSADVNAQNNKGNTALHMALSYDYIDCARALINAGADVNLTNAAGIPARKGLEGDKPAAMVLLGLADTSSRVMDAFAECEKSIADIDKAAFIGVCLKTKKTLGEQWTEEIQSKFKEITNLL